MVSAGKISDGDAYLYKLVIIGDGQSGKTCLLKRFEKDTFELLTNATIGVEFANMLLELPNGVKIRLQLWDTAGQQRYRAITKAYYRSAVGAIICYDITNRSSFDNLSTWLSDLKENVEPDICIMLVGCKLDIVENDNSYRQVTCEEGAKLAKELEAAFLEASAANSTNVKDVFEKLAHEVYFKRHGISGFNSILISVRKGHMDEGCGHVFNLHFVNLAGEDVLSMQFDCESHTFASMLISVKESLKDMKGSLKLILDDGSLLEDNESLSRFLGCPIHHRTHSENDTSILVDDVAQ